MNLFTRKMHLFCVSNIMLSFVCTGFLGINGIATRIGSTTGEAHEISLTASDTEPVSHYGEGENTLAFVTESIEAAISQQDDTVFPKIEGEENEFAFITQSVKAVINQQESTVAEKMVESKTTSKKSSKKSTTSVVTKKEVAKTYSYSKPSYSSVTGDAIVSFAKQFMGLRYVRAGRSLKTGTDCSGFTMLIYREFGVSLPPTVGGQISKGKYVAKGDLQKGDLVFYKAKGSKGGATHVAMYIGGGQVIHESRPGVGVTTTTVNMMQYVTARRVINSKATQIAQAKLDEQKQAEAAATATPTPTATNNTNTGSTTNNDNNTNNNTNNNVVVETSTSTPAASETPSTPTPSTPTPSTPTPSTPAPTTTTQESTSTEGSN